LTERKEVRTRIKQFFDLNEMSFRIENKEDNST
jgi:hypothetical protein